MSNVTLNRSTTERVSVNMDQMRAFLCVCVCVCVCFWNISFFVFKVSRGSQSPTCWSRRPPVWPAASASSSGCTQTRAARQPGSTCRDDCSSKTLGHFLGWLQWQWQRVTGNKLRWCIPANAWIGSNWPHTAVLREYLSPAAVCVVKHSPTSWHWPQRATGRLGPTSSSSSSPRWSSWATTGWVPRSVKLTLWTAFPKHIRPPSLHGTPAPPQIVPRIHPTLFCPEICTPLLTIHMTPAGIC